MSLRKKITDKLDALLKEEEEEYETIKDSPKTKVGNSKKIHKKSSKKTKEDWENIEEEGTASSSVNKIDAAGKNIKSHPSVDPLFPNDVAPVKETVTKKEQPWLKQFNDNFVKAEDVNEEKSDKLSLNSKPLLQRLESSDDFVEARMVELSKKIRELNAQLISTQNKLKITETRLISQESVQKEIAEPKEVSEDKTKQLETELKELNDKYQTCNAKLCESRNQIQQHKHEIKLLQKALSSEVGDNYSIHTVTSDGWRGRAQQICTLQQKVSELSDKLSLTSIPSIEKTVSAVQSFEKSQDKERIATLTKDFDDLKVQFNDTKNKGDQARARVNVLSADIAVLKTKYETLVAKNEEDVKLLNTLTTKIANIAQKNHDKEMNLVKRYDDQLAALNTELKQERVKTDQLQKIVHERDVRIKKLEEKIQEHYERFPQSCLIKNDGIVTRPQTSSLCSERPTTQQSLLSSPAYSQSIEVERLRLMELITVLNKRLDEERKTLDKIQDQLRLEKQKSAKLESKVNKLELERVGKSYKRPARRPESLNKFELENLKDHCSLLKEKCLALESRLDRLRFEKEEDARVYVRMVEEARATLRDQVRKGSSCSASS